MSSDAHLVKHLFNACVHYRRFASGHVRTVIGPFVVGSQLLCEILVRSAAHGPVEFRNREVKPYIRILLIGLDRIGLHISLVPFDNPGA